MFFWVAEAKTSAGAPWVTWVARPELGPKLKTTFVPGWAASNCLPRVVKASVREAAARTVIVPAGLAAEDEPDPADPPELDPQPANAAADRAADKAAASATRARVIGPAPRR